MSAGPRFPKIDGVQKRYRDGPLKGQFTGEWANEAFAYLADSRWRWTVKVDGTNTTVGITKADEDTLSIEFGGRTENAQIPATLVQKLHQRFTTPDAYDRIFAQFPEDTLDGQVTLYGEGYGAGIQKGGGYIPDGVDFILFEVRIGNCWLSRANVEDVAVGLGLDVVPVVGEFSLNQAIALIANNEIESPWPNAPLEGIVGHPCAPLFDRNGAPITAKVKGCDFR